MPAKLPPLPVEWVRLDDLLAAESNPKKHDLPTVMESIRRHGYVDHGVLDKRTGRLLGGHGRHDALEAMRRAGETPDDWDVADPHVHVDANGDWWVPSSVTTTVDSLDAEHLLLALNSGDRPGWDPDGLAVLLARQLEADQLLGTGYGEDDVVKMLADEMPDVPDDSDTAPQLGDTEFRVLVVCSDETIQQSLAEELEQRGYRVQLQMG